MSELWSIGSIEGDGVLLFREEHKSNDIRSDIFLSEDRGTLTE
jgi:hypothetical protein